MTRSAVWKAIKKLQTYGVRVNSVKSKGYALLEPLQLLEEESIQAHLQDDSVLIDVFEIIDSTNTYLKKIKSSHQIRFCLSELQVQGRGRLQREWYSPFAKNIYLSCLYPFYQDVSELAGLSLVVGLAILTTLKKYVTDPALAVKWPNDIIHAGAKLSGTLIEIQAETHGVSHVVIGVGINVNMLQAENVISQSWTSLQKITGKYIERNVLCAELIKTLREYLKKFEEEGFAAFVDEWTQADCLTDRLISLSHANQEITGKGLGVNQQGYLLLQMADDTLRAFSSGDTTILKKSIE